MQYAKIIVNTKTSQIFDDFTYKIPSKILPYIKIGSVVEIPFGRNKKIGIVYKLIKKTDYKNTDKLKEILSIVYPFSIFDELDFKIAQIIARYYMISIGKVLFFMLPKISKKIKQSLPIRKKLKNINKNNNYLIFDSKLNRYKHYEKIIKKVFTKKKSIMLIFPDFDANFEYIRSLQKKYNSIVYFPKMTTLQKTKNYIKLKNENNVLVIGTRGVIFNIPNNLDLIIIDEPTDFGYKEEQTIHYNCANVALFIKKIINCKIIFGENFYYQNQYFSDAKILLENKKYLKKIKLINAQNDIYFPIGYNLENTINAIVKNKKNVLLIVKSNDECAGLVCQNCGYIYRCNKCDNVLKIKEDKLYCKNCNKNYINFDKCKICKNTNLKGFGITSKNIYNKLVKIFNKNLIQIIDKEKTKINFKKQIFVVSKNQINYINNIFDYAIITDWQDWTYIKNINFIYELTKYIYKISAIVKNKIYIQTKTYDKLLEDLTNIKNYKYILKNDLINKKNFHYPPFYKIIILLLKNKENKDQKNISKLKSELIKSNLIIEIEILPNKYIKKYFISTIILKYKNDDERKIKNYLIKNYLKLNLNKYIIDVDPIKLI